MDVTLELDLTSVVLDEFCLGFLFGSVVSGSYNNRNENSVLNASGYAQECMPPHGVGRLSVGIARIKLLQTTSKSFAREATCAQVRHGTCAPLNSSNNLPTFGRAYTSLAHQVSRVVATIPGMYVAKKEQSDNLSPDVAHECINNVSPQYLLRSTHATVVGPRLKPVQNPVQLVDLKLSTLSNIERSSFPAPLFRRSL